MSGWADYVNYLLAGNVCQTGYILGKTNGAVWSTNTGLAAVIIIFYCFEPHFF